MTPYMIAFAVIMLAGAAGTFLVGFSKTNKEGNPGYDRSTTGNLSRLTLFYIVMVLILLVMLFLLFRQYL
ncbi:MULTISPECIES: hypothetical protein [Paenibacillus]|uniref:hypothetical protein n=1 Tax=Paenibacillus TaxID=44249 RepID=UPI0022B88B6B|nr:hypothetical protein [Paenibacillus caseinilyticus]MCZ8521152.1 hypothetical protein [Paenibacillus caseinilyticus]